jgi:hypothetical protein
MNIYQTSKSKNIRLLKEKPFKLEREIQLLVENDFPESMGLEIVRSFLF